MEKEFIPYEQALALKELGFDEKCCACYGSYTHKKTELFLNINNPVNIETLLIEPKAFNQPSFYVKVPTFSQAFRWFRDKYKLQAEILWRGDMECFCYKTGKFKYGSHDFSKDDYDSYEQAELECLKKLIEIVKHKKTWYLRILKE